jgi:SAM-dependent methyltransferase
MTLPAFYMPMSMYGKLCTEFYDIAKPDAPAEALSFYLRHLEAAHEPVLEPMCGSGRFLIPFLERGIDIDGGDASPHMLRACRDKCRRKGLSPVLYEQLLQEMTLPRLYGYIFIPACSFGLIIDRQAVTESLRRLYQHLLPGGELVLEVETPRAPPKELGKWRTRSVTRSDGAEIIFSTFQTYDSQEQIERDSHKYELFKDGSLIETELEDFNVLVYERDEFQKLLEAKGFINVRATKAYQDTEPDREDTTIVFEGWKS